LDGGWQGPDEGHEPGGEGGELDLLPEAAAEAHPLPPAAERRIVSRVIAQVTHHATHQGPLPRPETLAGYDAVHPGLAERIVAMAEREQLHRHALEREETLQPYRLAARGQVFGVTALTLIAALAAYLGFLGFSDAAAVVGLFDVASVVGIFVIGQYRGSREDRAMTSQPSSDDEATIPHPREPES
jgi:uncharacterized membrane protein